MAKEALSELDIDLDMIEHIEHDAGLGNGGLGRLAACFLESMASLGIAGHGCGIRYKYGLFEQKIINGFQVELPDNWLKNGNVWEIRKSDKSVVVKFGGNIRIQTTNGKDEFIHENYEPILGVPYDMPVIGYKNEIVNTLRLWSAESEKSDFDLSSFNKGDYQKAVEYKNSVEAISQILYPDDSSYEGKILRLKQQYFFVSSGLQSIVRRYKKKNGSLENFAEKIAVHINDTHPALCVPELMRILIDEEHFGWDEAWDITTNTLSYTNHTILPEALEKWPIDLFKSLLPRIYMIVEEINERFTKSLWDKYPGNWDLISDLAVISNGNIKMVNLAIVGSKYVNGVAKIHTEILKNKVMNNFYNLYPHKFNNKTNGVTHRRFLLKANPKLSNTISDAIGTKWIEKPTELMKLLKFKDDQSFREKIAIAKRYNKSILTKYIKDEYNLVIDETSIFDVHIKRIHAYKRQLMNVFHIMDLYNRLKENPNLDITPRTFIFAGKAAPGYVLAKDIIKLINTLAFKVNNDKLIKDKIKIIFIENYNVTLAEMLIPAADISEQISTASKEASGTGNMKFMMNGALTLGTLDGANVEIKDEVGYENMFIFGLKADEVIHYYDNGGYNAWHVYNHDYRIKKILNQLVDGFFEHEPEEFRLIYDSLLGHNDEFFVLKDFSSYVDTQSLVDEKYRDKQRWNKMCINNIAHSGIFSSDRTISEYAKQIWEINDKWL
ncbi:starch phosphorylase [Desulfonispora thiosulfatigenes DSM 11270]|uniref:Alpha-1,4 glucan phosphorylase n=1 Tax=Desulfonispora thiosulfatigenes DSM 11270 TaxID=656914 RepID=A0A1W1VLW2_DESTI|nr:starch phosphorylase [Desulfonispora thiosulfatigenes DSM 11270]